MKYKKKGQEVIKNRKSLAARDLNKIHEKRKNYNLIVCK